MRKKKKLTCGEPSAHLICDCEIENGWQLYLCAFQVWIGSQLPPCWGPVCASSQAAHEPPPLKLTLAARGPLLWGCGTFSGVASAG